ncbi:MAG: hypothetical protein HYU39_09235 [Thaumarchaeota archaeon]|nr:hypothetical protein [Nitrososphaerota archaeon]
MVSRGAEIRELKRILYRRVKMLDSILDSPKLSAKDRKAYVALLFQAAPSLARLLLAEKGLGLVKDGTLAEVLSDLGVSLKLDVRSVKGEAGDKVSKKTVKSVDVLEAALLVLVSRLRDENVGLKAVLERVSV